MKSLVIMILMFLMAYYQGFSIEPTRVSSNISDVTVFLNGAQVTRQAKVTLQKGMTTLLFGDLPTSIDPQSIQAKGLGDFTILSLTHQVNYLAGQRKSAQVKILQDSLKYYEDQLALVTGMQSVMNSEENMLVANQTIGSTEKGVVLAELKQAVDYFKSQLTEIKKEEIRLNREAEKDRTKIEKLRNQLNAMDADLKRPSSEIILNVSCNDPVSATLVITYTVSNAGWTPVYDLRAKDIQSPVQLVYNAKVVQNTGEDWNKVPLKLSTANPNMRGEKPELQPWFIDFEQPVLKYKVERGDMMKRAYAPAPEMLDVEADKMAEEAEPVTAAAYTEVAENQTNFEFTIRLPYDIPSDNKPYTINVQNYTLPATYEYYCAPRIDRDAFLLARITGWEDYNLLAGEMNLFFEGTFIGKSTLDVSNTKDTLDLSLGRDKAIIVTRERLKDFTAEKTIGSNKVVTRTWEIAIRNTKKQPIDLRIEDQMPVSMNKDIEVELQDCTGGKLNKESGLITWRQRMEPAAEKKLRISYTVKYPKDRQVVID